MAPRNDLARMLTDLANLSPTQEAIQRLQKKWPGFLPKSPLERFKIEVHIEEYEPVPEQFHYVLQLRDTVRKLWLGDPTSGALLEPLLLSGEMGVGSFGATLQETPPIYENFAAPPALRDIIRIDWKRRSFVYQPKTLLQEALYFLLQNANKTKVCGNPDCPAPYFIAPRTNTRYCSSDCVDAMQRQAKLEWWTKSGRAWREGRNAEAKPKKSERTGRK